MTFRKSITVNAGSKQGVKPNDIVVSNNALIGKVVSVSGGSCVVQLITDPASRIPGRVLQTREQVIVEGNATGFCQLKYVPRWAKLKKGDDIVSSDIGGFFPPSLPIATVVETEVKGGDLFQSVKVLPKGKSFKDRAGAGFNKVVQIINYAVVHFFLYPLKYLTLSVDLDELD